MKPTLVYLVNEPTWLDYAAQGAVIVTALTVVLALIQYVDSKRKEDLMAATDEISFFRKEVITAQNALAAEVLKADPKYAFAAIPLEKYEYHHVLKTYPIEVKEQMDLMQKQIVMNLHMNVINALEEFALRVAYSHTYDHSALKSLKGAFIQAVETNAMAIIFSREVFTGNSTFETTLKLYVEWNKGLDKRTAKERFEALYKKIEEAKS